ncbi:MAG TPA: heme peroxidase family protein [Pyrinomonadaceae bacterium]
MPRISHGKVVTLAQVDAALKSIHLINASFGRQVINVAPLVLTRFDYLFPDLQNDPQSRLPEHPDTVKNLRELGKSMSEAPGQQSDSNIPSAYTYFGQFVDHDITFEAVTRDIPLNDDNLAPLPLDEARQIKNIRTAILDLDSVYGSYCNDTDCQPPPRQGEKMLLQMVAGTPLEGHDYFNDLPREFDPLLNGAAKIGDGRNDENVMVSQMHVAFLRAHNAIVDLGNDFEAASRLLRQHYQWIVIGDFLDRIGHPETLAKVRADPKKFYDPPDDSFFIPLEFTVAAFRFGHSMVRRTYDLNEEQTDTPFGFTLMSHALDDYHNLLGNWVIRWKNFVRGGVNVARRLDTQLVEPLEFLRDENGMLVKFETRLAVRNLLRGYVLRMPTGQAVAQALGLPPEHRMSAADIEGVADEVSHKQAQVLADLGFSGRTPLWFYILAEAAKFGSGNSLGPVGTTLVASVLIGLVRRSHDSILKEQDWAPTLGPTPGQFTLPDLLRLAGVLAE